MQKNVALRIRSARRAAGFTQAELAARLRVSRSAVAQWENASGSMPAAVHFASLGHVLGCTFEWLATGRGRRLAPGHEAGADVGGRTDAQTGVDAGRPSGADARVGNPGLPDDGHPASFTDDGAIPAIALHYFARDDGEERLFATFRLLDEFDRNAVLLLAEALSSRPRRLRRRSTEM